MIIFPISWCFGITMASANRFLTALPMTDFFCLGKTVNSGVRKLLSPYSQTGKLRGRTGRRPDRIGTPKSALSVISTLWKLKNFSKLGMTSGSLSGGGGIRINVQVNGITCYAHTDNVVEKTEDCCRSKLKNFS
jgi:hypothetical protein